MKSSIDDLRKRGFVSKSDITSSLNSSIANLTKMLDHGNPFERTLAIIGLREHFSLDNYDYVSLLLKKLSIENALYTKIEICNSLQSGSSFTADVMCKYLGKIGNNQHLIVPASVSKKKSYPLPRDIIARCLGNMDKSVVSVLFDNLYSDDVCQISELIDAIGFLVYYNQELADSQSFNVLVSTYERFNANELVIWKIALCCSAFPIVESNLLLEKISKNTTNQTILSEVLRSKKIIDTNYAKNPFTGVVQ